MLLLFSSSILLSYPAGEALNECVMMSIRGDLDQWPRDVRVPVVLSMRLSEVVCLNQAGSIPSCCYASVFYAVNR